MEVHLDPVGGIAGDMFIAALLHAFPEHRDGLFDSINAMRLPGLRGYRLEAQQNHGLHGMRFLVDAAGGPGDVHPGDLQHAHHHGPGPQPPPHASPARDGHAHVTWTEIKELIGNAALAAEVKGHALAIFGLLARAEAQVHGIAEEHVGFH